jgi:hypothetical protein
MRYDKEKALKFLENPYPQIVGYGTPRRAAVASFLEALTRENRRMSGLVWDKHAFKAVAALEGKVPRTILLTADSEELAVCLATIDRGFAFVVKPNHLSQGVGVRSLEGLGAGRFADISGEELSIEDLVDEAEACRRLRRGPCGNPPATMVEERVVSHEAFAPWMEVEGAMADVRMLYLFGRFKCCYARFPTRESRGYGNYSRGATFGGTFGDGVFVGDPRFSLNMICDGELPFFREMRERGSRVVTRCQLPWQAVDMTVDREGEVVVVESETLPQLICLSEEGIEWLWGEACVGAPVTVGADRGAP